MKYYPFSVQEITADDLSVIYGYVKGRHRRAFNQKELQVVQERTPALVMTKLNNVLKRSMAEMVNDTQ